PRTPRQPVETRKSLREKRSRGCAAPCGRRGARRPAACPGAHGNVSAAARDRTPGHGNPRDFAASARAPAWRASCAGSATAPRRPARGVIEEVAMPGPRLVAGLLALALIAVPPARARNSASAFDSLAATDFTRRRLDAA